MIMIIIISINILISLRDLYGAVVDRRRQAVTLTTRHYHADSFGPLWTTLDDDHDDDNDDIDGVYDDLTALSGRFLGPFLDGNPG